MTIARNKWMRARLRQDTKLKAFSATPDLDTPSENKDISAARSSDLTSENVR